MVKKGLLFAALSASHFSFGADLFFAVIGDYGKDNDLEKKVSEVVHAKNPEFVITLGDNNYSDGCKSTIDKNIGKYYGRYILNYKGKYGTGSTTQRFYPSLGNHDWNAKKSCLEDGKLPYENYFELPGNERYYDFRKGPVHFFVLDSDNDEPDGNTKGSKQYQWFKSQITASTAPFKIVYFHHPAYTSAPRGNNEEMQWGFQELNVDVVLAGHEHHYERIERDGVLYLVNGAGGASLEPFEKPVAGSKVRYNAKGGAMFAELVGSKLTFSFVDEDGKEQDRVSIDKEVPSPVPTPVPDPCKCPCPGEPPAKTSGIWLGPDEIAKLPVSSDSFERLKKTALSSWGTADLSDIASDHDVKTYAGALYYARTGDAAMKVKVVASIESAMKTKLSNVLALARGLYSYVIAAELIGYQTPEFKAWLNKVVLAPIPGHSGVEGLYKTAIHSANNHGAHARAALLAVGLYLGDKGMTDAVLEAHKEIMGLKVAAPKLVWKDDAWHFDSKNKAGINRADAGYLEGLLSEEWRRTGYDWRKIKSLEDLVAFAKTKEAQSNYPWEGLQGAVATGVMLHRAGLLPIDAGDKALLRAVAKLYALDYWEDWEDEQWIPYVINYYYGSSFKAPVPGLGKAFGFTDWSHAR